VFNVFGTENETNDDTKTESCKEPPPPPTAAAAATAENASYHAANNGGCGGLPVIRRETILVDEFGGKNEHLASNSIPLTTYWQSTEALESPGVAEKVVRIESPPPGEEVDILIYLPHIDFQWLDEWSDMEVSSAFNVHT